MTIERPLFSGFITADGRRGGVCWDEKLRCVNHEIGPHLLNPDQAPIVDTIVQCRHRRRGGPRCGVHLYIAQLSVGGSPVIRGGGERIAIVVETTRAQAHKLRSVPMLFVERMILLGMAVPGVAEDLIRDIVRESA